jgi:hypothetical protein
MRALMDDLNTRVVVRRVAIGPALFACEVHRRSNIPPVQRLNRFRDMEAAHSAGQARLGEFLTTKSVKQEKVWRSNRIFLEARGAAASLNSRRMINSARIATPTTCPRRPLRRRIGHGTQCF